VLAKHSTTIEECRAIIGLRKAINGDIEWNNKPSNSSYIQASFVIEDENRITIPGLTVELHYRRGLIESECKYSFGIYQLKDGKKLRSYQLEVCPPDKQSHNEPEKKLFGPHHHIGTLIECMDSVSHLGCQNHDEWFRQFLKRGNIQFNGAYNPPDPPDPPNPQASLQFE
jgi:hypothetical protein